jgi:5'-3' exonuclease
MEFQTLEKKEMFTWYLEIVNQFPEYYYQFKKAKIIQHSEKMKNAVHHVDGLTWVLKFKL